MLFFAFCGILIFNCPNCPTVPFLLSNTWNPNNSSSVRYSKLLPNDPKTPPKTGKKLTKNWLKHLFSALFSLLCTFIIIAEKRPFTPFWGSFYLKTAPNSSNLPFHFLFFTFHSLHNPLLWRRLGRQPITNSLTSWEPTKYEPAYY